MADAKALFESLQSVHVYSLQPTPLTDLHVLTDVSRDITTTYAKEDPLEYGKKYGVIQNKNVKVGPFTTCKVSRLIPNFQRRTGRRPPPAPMTTVPTEPVLQARSSNSSSTKQESKPKDDASRPGSRSEDKKALQGSKGQAQSKSQNSQKPDPKSAAKPPGMKRDSSDIFKSFAKAKPKMKRQDTDSSAVESPADSVS